MEVELMDPDMLPLRQEPPPGVRTANAVLDDLPRVFALHRFYDPSGVTGEGVVAFGTVYPASGKVALAWLSDGVGHPSVGVYDSVAAVERIHCHGGATVIVWLTEPTWPSS